jgi:D-alanyl-D-alanine carboxypeptidase
MSAVALFALTPISGTATATPSVRDAANAKPVLQRIVNRLVRDGAPGALAVVRTPTAVHRAASGLAERDPRTPLRATDRFRIASLTKSFVATVVLQLVAEGKLSLTDPVERWLPGLVPNGGSITIRELLNHTSGLFNYTDDDGFRTTLATEPTRSWSPQELVAIAIRHPPLFPPGTNSSYSNTNYVLLGLIVETVTGTTLGQQLRNGLFQPLALGSTSLPTTLPIDGSYAHGYIGWRTLPSLPVGTLVDVSATLSPTWGWAAGGIVSDGDDVTRFYAALLSGKLLRPRQLRAMLTMADGSNYGLGLARFQTGCGTAYGHVGDFIGWRTVAYARPHGRRAAVVMVNIDVTHVPWGELETAAGRAVCSG